jgi:hypothetical protein
MRTQAHRIVDTDPKRGNVVVRVTGTRHDEPTYQVRQSLPNTQEVPGHDHHTNRVRETGSGSHGPILRSVPTNRLSQHLDRSSGSRHPDQLGLITLSGIVVDPRPFRDWRGRPNAGGERRR